MRHGIVGSEQAKFDARTEALARQMIRNILKPGDVVVSGACHLGGVDIFAREEGDKLGLQVVEYPPKIHAWEGGYRQRNEQIANDSDCVTCITVARLPSGYTGMTFPICYHCKTKTHVKSGGCWTVKYALRHGKLGRVLVVE
jgi:hypothetical protein